MKTFLLVAVILMSCRLAASAADAKKPADSYETLRTTTLFAFGGVGVAGTRVPAELAFDEVVKAPNASVLFKQLLSTATQEGQLYAMVGLYRIDREAFEAASAERLRSTAEVKVARGCMLSTEPANGIVKQIKAGDYD